MKGVRPFIRVAAKEKRRAIVRVEVCADYCEEKGAYNCEATHIMKWEDAENLLDTVLKTSAK